MDIVRSTIRHASVFLAGFIACAASLYAADDTLDVSVGYPQWGSSARLVKDSWGSVPINIYNRGDKPEEVIVSIAVKDRLGDVYRRRVTCGPHATTSYRLLMPVEQTDLLRITAARPGQPFFRREEIPTKVENLFTKAALFFITDDAAVQGISALKDKNDLIQNLTLSRVTSTAAPQHVLGYGPASMVVMLGVDFDLWGEKQFRALRQYVHSGGTLLFASPQTVMSLPSTPLADMLPGEPLQVREIASLPEPDGWSPGADARAQADDVLGGGMTVARGVSWPDGAGAMVRVAPAPDAIVSATVSGLPLVCWKRAGHGRVGVCAVSPFDEQLRDQPLADRLWNHLISWKAAAPIQTNALHTPPLKAATKRLIGFKAPTADKIAGIIRFYFVLLALLFLLGGVLKRHVTVWIGAAGFALLLTAGIFVAAYRQASADAPRMLTTLDLRLESADGTAGESVLGVFSTSDLRLDLRGTNEYVRFRSLPPVQAPFAQTRTQASAPITTVRTAARSEAAGLNVNALKPTQISAYYQTPQAAGPDPLEIGIDANGWRVDAAELAAAAGRQTKAYLLFGNGFRVANIADGKAVLRPATENAVELDPVLLHIQDFFRRGRLPAPSVALVSNTEDEIEWLTSGKVDLAHVQTRINVIPASLRLESGADEPISIGREAIGVQPVGPGSATLYWNNEWQKATLHGGGTSTYLMALILPPETAGRIEFERIELDIPVIDPTGNIVVLPELVPVSMPGAEPDDSAAAGIAPTTTDGSRHVFELPAGAALLDPALGRIYVRLKARSKIVPKDTRLSAGQWQIKRFDASLRGTLKTGNR